MTCCYENCKDKPKFTVGVKTKEGLIFGEVCEPHALNAYGPNILKNNLVSVVITRIEGR